MVINLTRCVGCYGCVIACKTEHFLPPDVAWNRVMVFEAEELNLHSPQLSARDQGSPLQGLVPPKGAQVHMKGKQNKHQNSVF